MGEHAAVYGQPAIALPFSAVQIQATVTDQGQALSVSCDFYDGLVHQMPKIWESLKHAIRFLSTVLERLAIRPFMFRLIQPSQLNGDGVQCSSGCCGGQGSFAFFIKRI